MTQHSEKILKKCTYLERIATFIIKCSVNFTGYFFSNSYCTEI